MTRQPAGNQKWPGELETAEAASQYLITEHSICTVPWDDAGASPCGFSVTYEARRRAGRRRGSWPETEKPAEADSAGVLMASACPAERGRLFECGVSS